MMDFGGNAQASVLTASQVVMSSPIVSPPQIDKLLSKPRQYQIEIFQSALSRNVIAVLDTGTGKTLISVLVIKHMLQIEQKYRETTKDRRITIFLVNLVPLVTQQTEVLANNLSVKVKQYCGESKADSWNTEKWEKEFFEAEVMVMTAQVLLNVLRHGFISMKKINLLVFDECHHAKKQHPYNLIMREFYDRCLPTERPKIFGMTASLNGSKIGVNFSASSLEANLASTIVTMDETQIQDFINRPKEYFIKYNEPPQYDHTPLYRSFKEEFLNSELLKKAFNVADLALVELGPWCSDQIWEYMLNTIQESFTNSLSYPRTKFEQLAMRRSFEILANQRIHGLQLSPEFVSPKILKLIEILRFYESSAQEFCGIIFVEKRFTAYVLKALLDDVSDLGFLRTGILVGHGGSERGDIRMKSKEQNKVIDGLRRGDVNLLIATNVAEEGLDIQPCNLVIRFDFFHSLTGYIQSRGRARRKNSKYILMIEKGNVKQGKLYCEIKSAEEAMKSWCLANSKSELEIQRIDSSQVESSQTIYVSPKTGAICSLNSSVALIHYFCSFLSNDSYTNSVPRFEISSEGSGYICRLLMPKNSPIQEVIGDLVPSKRLAKQSVALRACIRLHELGALDDRLLPAIQNVDDDDDVEEDSPVSNDGTLKSRQVYPGKAPDFWSIRESSNNHHSLYMTTVKINHLNVTANEENELRAFGIITRGKPLTVPSFNVYVKGVPRRVNLNNNKGGIKLDDGQIEVLSKYTLNLFSLLLRKKLAHSSEDAQYYIVPLNCMDTLSIDWDEVYAGTSHETLPIDYSIDRDIIVVDECEYQKRYFLKSVRWDLSPESRISPNQSIAMEDSKYSHIADYYEEKYKKSIIDWKQPIFQVEEAPKALNFLSPIITSSPKVKSTSSNFIIPEFASKLSISASTYRAAMFLPSILTRIESLLLVKELKEGLSLDVDDMLLMEAFSIPSANLDVNYERLETLGDSFLKLSVSIRVYLVSPDRQEGQLHSRRVKSISNSALYRNAVKLELYKYVTSSPFNRKQWLPPNYTTENALNSKCTLKHGLADKTLADVLEASLGACYLSKGVESALDCAIKMKVPFPEIRHWKEFATLGGNISSLTFSDETEPAKLNFHEIESSINYKFRNPRLLSEALTHPSFPNPDTPCYQRLEFLGDAVLDFLVVSYLFDKYPDISPAKITELKAASVSNNFLSIISYSLGLHQHLIHSSSLLSSNLSDFIDQLEDVQKSKQSATGQYWLKLKPPKVIADLLESLFGAVFVDCKFELSPVKAIFEEHIKPILDKDIRPQAVEIHPMVKLTIMVQKMGCIGLTFKNTTTKEGNLDTQKCDIFIHDTFISSGVGTALRAARKDAATSALEILNADRKYLDKICDCPRKK